MSDEANSLLRTGHGHQRARVTFIELFFDLVFVFAITQLSHNLMAHFTLQGVLETAILFLAIWWVWINTSWVTNWLDPEAAPVRALLIVMMLAGLVLSASIPTAFHERAHGFVGAYVCMQIGRDLFMLATLRKTSPGNFRNFQRIIVWHAMGAACWIFGAFQHDEARLAFWLGALTIETFAPALFYWVPGLGGSTTADWDISGAHMAERCGLFVIIALGESILVTGATFAGLTWDGPTISAFAAAFTGSAAMWLLYFSTAEFATKEIETSVDPGRLARSAYTYIHLLIVAGIVVSAAGDESSLAHPTGHLETSAAIALTIGPALYLLGLLMFKRIVFGAISPYLAAAIVALALVYLFGATHMEPHAFAWFIALVLLFAALWGEGVRRARLTRESP